MWTGLVPSDVVTGFGEPPDADTLWIRPPTDIRISPSRLQLQGPDIRPGTSHKVCIAPLVRSVRRKAFPVEKANESPSGENTPLRADSVPGSERNTGESRLRSQS